VSRATALRRPQCLKLLRLAKGRSWPVSSCLSARAPLKGSTATPASVGMWSTLVRGVARRDLGSQHRESPPALLGPFALRLQSRAPKGARSIGRLGSLRLPRGGDGSVGETTDHGTDSDARCVEALYASARRGMR
jgi:hypothetical protein